MKAPLVCAVALSLILAPGATAQSVEEQVADRVLSFYQALNDGDAQSFASHTATDQTGSFPREGAVLTAGTPDPTTMQANFDSGALDYNLSVRHLEVAPFGDVAVATFYTVGPSDLPSGETITGTFRVSQVWIMEAGEWRLAHFHISPLVS